MNSCCWLSLILLIGAISAINLPILLVLWRAYWDHQDDQRRTMAAARNAATPTSRLKQMTTRLPTIEADKNDA